MKRGQLYRVHKPSGDPKTYRTFVIVSRQALIDSRFSTLICAPVFTNGEGLSTQVLAHYRPRNSLNSTEP
jgi:mRNA interferase MazF